MSETPHVEAILMVGRNARDARSYGRYRFATAPRIGEEILVDREQGDGATDAIALKVTGVSHIPVSLEAPMGPIPTVDSEYIMIFCAEN